MDDRSGERAKKLLSAVTSADANADGFKDILQSETLEASQTLGNLRKIQSHILRNRWEKRIFWLLCFTVIFQVLLVIAVGFGILKFSGYEHVPSVIGGALFIETMGLCAIVVKGVFHDGDR